MIHSIQAFLFTIVLSCLGLFSFSFFASHHFHHSVIYAQGSCSFLAKLIHRLLWKHNSYYNTLTQEDLCDNRLLCLGPSGDSAMNQEAVPPTDTTTHTYIFIDTHERPALSHKNKQKIPALFQHMPVLFCKLSDTNYLLNFRNNVPCGCFHFLVY